MSLSALLPLFALLTVLISLLVLAEIMEQLFLRPILAMQGCADEIASTADLDVKINITSNDEFALMGSAFNQMTQGLKEKQRLSRFVSGRLLQSLSHDAGTKSSAERVFVSLLFSDIRNFTAITEKNAPATVVEMLNQYFTEMETAIIECGGTIDRFVGDAVIAVFYPDACAGNTATSACTAAVQMRKHLARFNQQRSDRGKFVIANGIGIASGEVISGSIGQSGHRLEYSVVGKTVALANQLEGRTKDFENNPVLVDETTAELAAGEFEFLAVSDSQKEFQLVEKSHA